MIKIYGVPGKTSAVLHIPFGTNGKNTLEVEFSRGCIDRKNYRPATYRCANENEQFIIENSSYYGRQIILLKTIGGNAPAPSAAPARKAAAPVEKKAEEVAPAAPAEVREFPDVTTWEQCVAVLKADGAKAIQYKDPTVAKRYANTHNIVFPNYNFE